MSTRFDEVELRRDPLSEADDQPRAEILRRGLLSSRPRRLVATIIDLSIFGAIGIGLSPLLELRDERGTMTTEGMIQLAGLTLFLLLFSYYYFAVSWFFWGRTIGGVIADVRVARENGAPVTMRNASVRWLGTILSVATAGIGFLIAVLPGARSLADRMSATSVFTISTR